jgi:hypothetical protein
LAESVRNQKAVKASGLCRIDITSLCKNPA